MASLGPVILFNILGWLYSAPPFRLHSRRLGEITIAVGTSFCVPAVGYIVAQGKLDGAFMLFTAPLMLYGLLLSLCLQVPDLETDQALGKRTLAGMLGRHRTYLLVLLCSIQASTLYIINAPNITGHIWAIILSLIPVSSSLSCVLMLGNSQAHSRTFTLVNVSALFLLLLGLNIILVFNL